jgi:hypothetical protein
MREDAGIVGAYRSGVQAGLTELVGGGPTVGARARPPRSRLRPRSRESDWSRDPPPADAPPTARGTTGTRTISGFGCSPQRN